LGDLKNETLAHMEGYLAGRESGVSVAQWATGILSSDSVIESPLLEEAMVALANLDHGDERLDTPQEDLKFFRECLQGKRTFEPAAQIVEKRTH